MILTEVKNRKTVIDKFMNKEKMYILINNRKKSLKYAKIITK